MKKLTNTLIAILTHQQPELVVKMHGYWADLFPSCDLLIVYGGTKQNYEALELENKCFVDAPHLRTKDHQRERQSYFQVHREIKQCLESNHDLIFFTEFDQIPTSSESLMRLIQWMSNERADLICYNLHQVNNTNHPHYLYHVSETEILKKISEITKRENKNVVLSSSGFGQLWKRDAFVETVTIEDSSRVYLELWFPTIAHHLGYRVRGVSDNENTYNNTEGEVTARWLNFTNKGAMFVHPVKDMWH